MGNRGIVTIVLGGLLVLAVACSPSGAEESASVEVGLPPTEPAQVMGEGDASSGGGGVVVTPTPEQSAEAAATAEASNIGPIDEVTLVLGFDFPFPEDSTVELTEDESLAVVNSSYTLEEATSVVEGTMAANGYELVNQAGSAEEELVYTFQQDEKTVTITVSPSEEGDGTRVQFAAE